MSKHQKALIKLCSKPTPADIKWSELKGVLEHLGYDMLKNSGSRRKFVHKTTKAVISCHEPHPYPEVPKWCVELVVDHLKDQGLI